MRPFNQSWFLIWVVVNIACTLLMIAWEYGVIVYVALAPITGALLVGLDYYVPSTRKYLRRELFWRTR